MVAYAQQHPTPRLTGWLTGLILVVSLAATLDDAIYARLALVPEAVWRGELWRLVTWALVETGPMALIVTCVAMYWLGGSLRSTWGTRPFAGFLAAIVLSAGIGTSLLGLVLPMAWSFPQFGGLAVAAAIVIAWALQYPDERLVVYWVVVTGGKQLAYGTLGVILLFAFFVGIVPMLPELIACTVSLLYSTKTLRRWQLLSRAFLAQRKLDRYRRQNSAMN
jgi:membrane associated rhomboid family serine protease